MDKPLIPIAEDEEFLKAALRYPQDVFVASEILRFIPTVLAGYVYFRPNQVD